VIEVRRAGLLDLVVDGRPRRAMQYGLSEAGPLDAAALRAANRAVGNPPEAAGLEMLAKGPELVVLADVRLCLAGGGLAPCVDGEEQPVGTPFAVRTGAVVTFVRRAEGLRAYLAVAGGLDVPPVFASRSADLPSELPGLAGRPLGPGDRLPVGMAPAPDGGAGPPGRAGPERAPGPAAVDGSIALTALPGPQWAMTPAPVRRHLFAARFRVTPQANRVGVILQPLEPAPAWAFGDMVSEGTVAGALQWPPSGLPVLLLADRGSIGGYPKPLQLTAVDTWRAAQLRPGQAVRFVRTTRRAAWAAVRVGETG